MHHASSLSRGLLGHWPGERSPTGRVWDRSPAGHHGTYGTDARWIWFTNPRAVRHVGRHDRTYLAYLGGPTGRDLVVAAYDHDQRTFEQTVIDAEFSADDHTNPSLHVRPDGHLLVFWTGHNGEALHFRRSAEPERIGTFDPTRRLEQESVTYPNPVRGPGDSDALYLFYRDRVYTSDATDDRWGYAGDGNLYYRISEDGGASWSDQTRLVTPPEGHYSMYFVPARGEEAIHFFFTDAERGGDAPKWNVMYAAFRDGHLYAADGRELARPGALPATKADLEVVYDSNESGNAYAWLWDAAVDDDGHPVAAYATFPSTLEHEYRYARWDGTGWRDYHLAEAGRYIARRPIELHYSGGLSIDRADPTVVYGCIVDGDECTIRRFETQTGGETWAELAVPGSGSGWDIRPVVPRNASEDVPVLWLTGSYKHMDTSQTVLRGLPSDRLRGDCLDADGRQGVDLGLDLYEAATFRDGLTVAAWIEPRTIDTPGVIANLGGGITLGTGLDGEVGVGVALAGDEERQTVTAPEIPTGERVHVAGRWDGADTLGLAIDGEPAEVAPFAGPISFSSDWASWTLLKGEYLIDRGFDGRAGDVRIYDRSLSDDEIGELAERAY